MVIYHNKCFMLHIRFLPCHLLSIFYCLSRWKFPRKKMFSVDILFSSDTNISQGHSLAVELAIWNNSCF